MSEKDDVTSYLESLDRFLDNPEKGTVPLALLAERGIEMPPSRELSEKELGERLTEVIQGMGAIGMYLTWTDHMSDRELYDYLREDALRIPELILPEQAGFACNISPIGSGSEEDNEIYLRYYADDEEREQWLSDFPEDVLPDRETLPYDRDRFLPNQMERLYGPVH